MAAFGKLQKGRVKVTKMKLKACIKMIMYTLRYNKLNKITWQLLPATTMKKNETSKQL